MRKFALAILLAVLAFSPLFAQRGTEDLKKDFPLLMENFGQQLSQNPADYIFAIDISGSMGSYESIVVPALQQFFDALPDGDHVSIITFGEEAKDHTRAANSSATITDNTRKDLALYAEHIYDKPAKGTEDYKRYFLNTNLGNMVRAVSQEMFMSGRSNMKFVFIITDFHNDPAQKGLVEDWDGLKKDIDRQLKPEHNINTILLQLPVDSPKELPDIKNVFSNCHPQTVPVTSSDMLQGWFNDLKNQILLERFRRIIYHYLENGAAFSPECTYTTDIDGNLSLSLGWQPNEVFTRLRLDSIAFTDNDFFFEPNKKKKLLKYNLPMELAPELTDCPQIGRVLLKKRSFFHPCFRKPKGEIVLYSTFLVPYSDEVTRLLKKDGIPEIGNARIVIKADQNKLFCHPMKWKPFLWMCGLILLYIVMCLVALRRNSKYVIQKNYIEITANGTTSKVDRIKGKGSVEFGKRQGQDWNLKVSRKNCCWWCPIVHIFHKPKFRYEISPSNYTFENGRTKKNKATFNNGSLPHCDIYRDREKKVASFTWCK